jgi:hypothetical protein
MEIMIEEEAFALDEHYTNNPPKVDPSKARIWIPVVRVDSRTSEDLLFLSRTTRRTLEEIVSEMVREELSLQCDNAPDATPSHNRPSQSA